jgi:hypothetical protein
VSQEREQCLQLAAQNIDWMVALAEENDRYQRLEEHRTRLETQLEQTKRNLDQITSVLNGILVT